MLSIITVVFNDKEGFEKTVKSIKEQKKYFKNFEYVVIDGGSQDNIGSVFERYSEYIDVLISEPDEGIYDAMNKGIKSSNGSAYLFLNAGDYFVGDVLSKYDSSPMYLPVKYKDFKGKLVERKIMDPRAGIPNCHQGIIFESQNIRYNTEYKICADYDFCLRYGYGKKIPVLDSEGYVYFDNSGVSSTNIHRRAKEAYSIRLDHFGLVPAILYSIIPYLKLSIRKVTGL